jgi:hypothetical protein
MAGFTGAPPIVTDGLVFAVDAANKDSYSGSGTVWKDLSGNGNDGTLTNGPTFDSGNGGNLTFTSDDYTNFQNGSIFNLTSDFTLSVWFKPYNGTHGNYAGIFCKDGAGNFGNWGFFGDASSNYVRFGFLNTSSVQQQTLNSSYLDLDTTNWVNYQGVYSSSNTTLLLYRNGTLISTKSNVSGTPQTNSNNVYVGIRNAGSSNRFNGSISNCSIYNKSLSPSEITQNYNALKGRFNL